MKNLFSMTTNLKTFNTILKRSIHTAKKQYYNSCFDKYKNNIKQTWSTINNILNKNNKKHKFPDLFNINGTLTNNKKDIVNSFNRYFCNIGPKLESAIIIDSNKSYNHYLKNPTTATFHFEPTNSTTVTKIINELKTRHSTGPDGLSTKLLQYIKEPLIEAITIIYFQWQLTLKLLILFWKEASIQRKNSIIIPVLTNIKIILNRRGRL